MSDQNEGTSPHDKDATTVANGADGVEVIRKESAEAGGDGQDVDTKAALRQAFAELPKMPQESAGIGCFGSAAEVGRQRWQQSDLWTTIPA